eukprot:gnl/MRDRNA2_/MRDRNA2_17011_c0_seq1.p1 gnl/MRDRNA2_/MRDRNA2_17011_c0~~gnl/MRDRNA2_/MRDRNA2_17011_c0_seq1.p1  ORF type:complete len:201 (-),score=21.82 gnl/MRDRNA2_/MRDRNA2_17011_c0_seq1:15-617(-)
MQVTADRKKVPQTVTGGFSPWGGTKKRSPVYGWSPGTKPTKHIGCDDIAVKTSPRSESSSHPRPVADYSGTAASCYLHSPRYLNTKGASVGSVGAYKPLGGKNGTSAPGNQYWPHPPDGGAWHGEISNNMKSYSAAEIADSMVRKFQPYNGSGRGKNSGFCINRSPPIWHPSTDNVVKVQTTASSSYQPPKYKIFSSTIQ